jgi:hypothetical protein
MALGGCQGDSWQINATHGIKKTAAGVYSIVLGKLKWKSQVSFDQTPAIAI